MGVTVETLELEIDEHVAWVWLNQPRRLNAITHLVLDELRQTFESLDGDESVRVIILAGRGPVFSAGFDVEWMSGLRAEMVKSELPTIRAIFDRIESCGKPLIAAMQGRVVGAGLLLALAADIRLTAERTQFRAPEVMIGIFPALGLIPRLVRQVGPGAAKWLALTGSSINADEALRVGLVNRIVPRKELYDEARKLAGHIAALPPNAVRLTKAAFAALGGVDYATWEIEQFAACWALPERKAAMEAFLKPGKEREHRG